MIPIGHESMYKIHLHVHAGITTICAIITLPLIEEDQ